jgi:hypothetical protein
MGFGQHSGEVNLFPASLRGADLPSHVEYVVSTNGKEESVSGGGLYHLESQVWCHDVGMLLILHQLCLGCDLHGGR